MYRKRLVCAADGIDMTPFEGVDGFGEVRGCQNYESIKPPRFSLPIWSGFRDPDHSHLLLSLYVLDKIS